MPKLPPPPEGVTLHDPEDTDAMREMIFERVKSAAQKYMHGYTYGGVRLELDNVGYVDKPRYTLQEIQEAKLNDAVLARRLRATVRLVDDATNEPLDSKTITLARVPYLTPHGTVVSNGSEYSLIMQSRLLPGSYTRKRDNGELENHFNTRPGTGPAMRLSLDPETAAYRLRVGTSNVHAYSVFKDMGVTDEELERRWGADVLEMNRSGYDPRALSRVYAKAVPKWERDDALPMEKKAEAVRNAFGNAQVAETVLKGNLPNLYSQEKSAAWRRNGRAVEAARKMTKSADFLEFRPDYSATEMLDAFLDSAFEKVAAEFSPDLSTKDMRESYNSIYGKVMPRLASMQQWPDHWLDSQDSQGWLQWFANYEAGRRSDQDERQIGRWRAFKARHGSQLILNPTPRRAFALKNWAIDPLKMVEDPAAREKLRTDMAHHRASEYVKWLLRRHDFDETTTDALLRKAKARGADVTGDRSRPLKLLTGLAISGHIKPEDIV